MRVAETRADGKDYLESRFCFGSTVKAEHEIFRKNLAAGFEKRIDALLKF
jgi:hypothetical protein